MTFMHSFQEAFAGKSITVLGLGLLGRGVGDVEFLAEHGTKLTVTDRKSADELAPSLERLKRFNNITFHLGGHDKNDFVRCDMVLKAAGVPLDSPEIAVAREAGVPVVMSTALFAKYASEIGAKIVGVTGTRGKSTIVHMIHHVLTTGGGRSHLGGNIRGLSTLALLPKIKKGDVVILELDSWQLQGFGDLRISPHISVFANLMSDHKNYYPDEGSYFNDKANIFRYQKSKDVLIVSASIAERVRTAHPPLDPIIPDAIARTWKLKILGEHNRENASLAAAALAALGVSEDEIKKGIESFEPVEGRLQFVREVNGVRIYNDNNATTPEATIAALRALGKNIVLIAGGADKNLSLNELVSEIKARCKAIHLLSGTGTERINKNLPDARVFDTLKSALAAAFATADSGDIILFSPAFASFGMFKNEYDRNDQFLALMHTL